MTDPILIKIIHMAVATGSAQDINDAIIFA